MKRQNDGRETWHRLLNWDKGQAPSERLSAQILINEKYDSVDPQHPLGGRDGLKDILCKKEGLKFIAACYFPRGQMDFVMIKEKFNGDVNGISKNDVDGIVFITNQELRLSEREELSKMLGVDKYLDLFHLERITAILNSAVNYGTRLEFLDIEMTKEEQLAYMGSKDQIIHDLINMIKQIQPYTENKIETSIAPVTVSAQTFETYNFGAPYQLPYHKCSFCGYGFKIAGRGMGYFTFYRPVNTFVSLGEKITLEYATCPKCGNTENA